MWRRAVCVLCSASNTCNELRWRSPSLYSLFRWAVQASGGLRTRPRPQSGYGATQPGSLEPRSLPLPRLFFPQPWYVLIMCMKNWISQCFPSSWFFDGFLARCIVHGLEGHTWLLGKAVTEEVSALSASVWTWRSCIQILILLKDRRRSGLNSLFFFLWVSVSWFLLVYAIRKECWGLWGISWSARGHSQREEREGSRFTRGHLQVCGWWTRTSLPGLVRGRCCHTRLCKTITPLMYFSFDFLSFPPLLPFPSDLPWGVGPLFYWRPPATFLMHHKAAYETARNKSVGLGAVCEWNKRARGWRFAETYGRASEINFCSLSTLSGPHFPTEGHMPLNVRMNAVQTRGLISDWFRDLQCIFVP